MILASRLILPEAAAHAFWQEGAPAASRHGALFWGLGFRLAMSG